MPDILMFMSDQHTPLSSSAWGGLAETPNMEALCGDGVDFSNSYTSCPLCVPARMSMLTGLLPSRTGILTNDDTLSSLEPTFVHALANAGYETTLVGRMHFIGQDQRHGFLNRLVGDTTPVTWARPTNVLRQVRGVYLDTYRDTSAATVIGGGASPVLEYDEDVVKAAIDYLARPHEKPQFVLIGTYGPHFPYVAPPALYEKYLARVSAPPMHDGSGHRNPLLEKRARGGLDEQTARRVTAAYCGMIEQTDLLLGRIRTAWERRLAQSGKPGVFVYLSDHGDMCAQRGLLGKNTFYERAARIPMIFSGSGIVKGKRVAAPASLLDLGPTLCALAGTNPPPAQDGQSLLPELCREESKSGGRAVVSELLHGGEHPTFARMVRWEEYKLIAYHNLPEELYNLEADPGELCNIAGERPEIVRTLQSAAASLSDPGQVEREQELRARKLDVIRQFERLTAADQSEMWIAASEEAKRPPVVQ